jgi:hypothetical protein
MVPKSTTVTARKATFLVSDADEGASLHDTREGSSAFQRWIGVEANDVADVP